VKRLLRAYLMLWASWAGMQVSCAQKPVDPDTIPVNFIQTIGTHNSYRRPMEKRVMRTLRLIDLFYGKNPSPAEQLEYAHLPFDQQFGTYGVRGLEIDIHHDPEGGRYYRTKGNIAGARPSVAADSMMLRPGMKVFHISDIDYNSHYRTFREALRAVKAWSETHPRHMPIYILVEPKEEGVGDHVKGLGFVTVLPFDNQALNDVDAEIREVFADDTGRVFRPDDLRRGHISLKESVLTDGWPLLRDMRGKVVFIINGSMRHTDMYAEGHASFAGRMMFSFSSPERDDAAFIKRDDAFALDIPELVQQGYMVRTRTDSPGHEARANDHRTKDAAMLSGAQLLCTDYPLPDPTLSPFQVGFENGALGKFNFMMSEEWSVVSWE
jgi:hypothetical protein